MEERRTGKKICILVLGLWIGFQANAQQDPMFTQYMFNTLSINSGYAGSREALSVNLLAREQWVGLDGRPRTQTLTIHTPLPFENLAGGLSVVNDKIGPVQTTGIYLDVAYGLKLGPGRLNLGLKGGVNVTQGSLSTLYVKDNTDEVFSQQIQGELLPNFGFGAYYSTPDWYVGVSAPKILQNEVGNDQVTIAKERRHYFLIAGGVLDMVPGVKFKPTALVKAVTGAPVEAEVSLSALLRGQFWVGAMYRIEDAVGVILQYEITPQLRIGYAYDYTLTEMGNYNQGTHEVMIGYDFDFKEGNVRSPRYF